ncbi:MAG: DNA methyltransferase [Candidatus Micrarchaeaceae archaeon]
MTITLYNADALEKLKELPADSIDAIITDPPYQLSAMTRARPDQSKDSEYGEVPFSRVQAKTGFMGKEWDVLPNVDTLKECLRVLKPGAFAMWLMTPRQDSYGIFLGRLAEAGFNISFTSLYWIYASGFPKASNISLQIDKEACKKEFEQEHPDAYAEFEAKLKAEQKDAEITPKMVKDAIREAFNKKWKEYRKKIAYNPNSRPNTPKSNMELVAGQEAYITEPRTEEAKALNGSYAGFQPKPAIEVIVVSMKPLSEKTYVEQALKNKHGISWLDDCRIPFAQNEPDARVGTDIKRGYKKGLNSTSLFGKVFAAHSGQMYCNKGRFPANIIVSDNAINIGINKDSKRTKGIGGFGSTVNTYSNGRGGVVDYERGYDDSGDLSRYFSLDAWWEQKVKELPEEQQKIFPFLYTPKASKSERNEGLHGELKQIDYDSLTRANKETADKFGAEQKAKMQNIHPTVKPIAIMSYLITLASREGDTILDPFIGSGTTAIASYLLKRNCIGIEREKEYYDIAQARISYYEKQMKLCI